MSDDDLDDDVADVLELRPTATVEENTPPPISRDPRASFERCEHPHVWIDTHDRRVTCKTCGEDADPISLLASLAHDMTRMYWRSKAAREKCREYEEAIVRLKRQHKKLQDAIRREQTRAKKIGAVE